MADEGELKGWQAVPVIIPSFLIISIGTIWYFTFHHLKNMQRFQNFTSSMNSSSRPSTSSDVGAVGPRDPSHLVHVIDIPPLPAMAFSNERLEGSPVPSAALRAQRSKESVQSVKYSDRPGGEIQRGSGDESVGSVGWNPPRPDRPYSYVIDLGIPPPIPAAHLNTRISAAERPRPLTPLNALQLTEKRKPALDINLRSPLSQLSTPRGIMRDIETTMVADGLVADGFSASTRTPSPFPPEWLETGMQEPFSGPTNPDTEPKKIFVAKNPNSIFSSIKRESNPANPTNASNASPSRDCVDQASTTTRKSHLRSVTDSLRSLVPATHSHVRSGEVENAMRPSISGPSLYTFPLHSPEWTMTDNEVFRNASPIANPLIEHPDLRKGFQRPKEWGEKTPDLIEAEVISRQMRMIERLQRERGARRERERAWERDWEKSREACYRERKEFVGNWREQVGAGTARDKEGGGAISQEAAGKEDDWQLGDEAEKKGRCASL